MSDTPAKDELRIEQMRAAIDESRPPVRHMAANVEHMRSEREKWQREDRRETARVVLYGLIAFAATPAAGGALVRGMTHP